jgi:predicted DNA-binding protein YlxM (UPF0122 family)
MDNYKNKQWLEDQYINKRKSMQKIADMFNVDRGTINWFMKKFNIPRRNLRESHLGYKMPEEQKQKIKESMKGKVNYFKGKDAGYQAKHIWLRKNKLKPKYCEICKKETKLDLCNINDDHDCTRDLKDYIYTCRSCHLKYEYRKGIR